MSDEDDGDDQFLWWGKPNDSRRFHIFQGKGPMAESLCGNWMYAWNDANEEVDPEEDGFKDGQDCKSCSREAGVLES